MHDCINDRRHHYIARTGTIEAVPNKSIVNCMKALLFGKHSRLSVNCSVSYWLDSMTTQLVKYIDWLALLQVVVGVHAVLSYFHIMCLIAS